MSSSAPGSDFAPPAGFDLLDHRRVMEHVSDGRRVELRRQKLRVPGPQPLALRRLFAVEGPRGPAVVLVHGLGQNRRTWRLPGRSMEAALAAEGFEVYNLELRGHGDSAALGSAPAHGLHDYVEDLSRTLAALPAPAFCVGHSLGGAVLVKALADAVPMAGMVHLAGVYTFAQENLFLRGATAFSRRLASRMPPGFPLPMGPVGRLIAWRPGLSERLNPHAPISGWASASLEPALLADRVKRGFDTVGWGVWLELARLAGGAPIDPTGGFAANSSPLLVLSGAGDKLATADDARACFDASQSPDKSMVVFDQATHGYAPGHLDIIVGRRAPAIVWPVLFAWLHARAKLGLPRS